MSRLTLKPRLRVDLLLDSGAFSAWNRNEQISLRDYIDFIKAFRPYIWQHVCLDTIPGKPHTERSPKEVKYAAAKSYENQQEMKAAGLSPIPVFHQGEDYRWLERYMEDKEPYIGISPLDDTPRNAQRRFLANSYSVVCNAQGLPLAKTHVFGSTAFDMLHQFPMTTADSTAWYYGMIAYGGMRIPHLEKNGEPDFTEKPEVIYFSGATSFAESENPIQTPQFLALPPDQQETVTRYIERFVGCTPTEIRYSTYWRVRSAITHYENIAKAASGKPFVRTPPSLLEKLKSFTGTPVTLDRSIVYATMMTRVRTRAINDLNIRKRLLSYTAVRENTDDFVKYVTHGTLWHGDEEREPPPGIENVKNWNTAVFNYRALRTLDRIASYKEREHEPDFQAY